MFGPDAVAKAKRVTKIRRVRDKNTGQLGEITGSAPQGWVKVKWDNRDKPTLIKRSEIALARGKRNPQTYGGLYHGAYKGYLIKEDFGGWFHVSKDGHHITTQNSLQKAKKAIDELTKTNPSETENQKAWRKGYEHGYKGLNSRPDYPKVGLAGSYRLGYEAGEQRRKGKAQPQKNPRSAKHTCYYCGKLIKGEMKVSNRVGYHPACYAKAEREAEKQLRRNPKREAKTSKDAFGVTHENPSKAKKVFRITWFFKDGTSQSFDFADKNAALVQYEQGKVYGNVVRVRGEVVKQENLFEKVKRQTRKSKRNPSVAAIAEKFQGKTDGAIEEFHAASSAPANLARAGKLVFLKVGAKTFRLPGAMVAIAPNEKLWIVSKRAPVFSTKAKPGEGLDVGEITQICYETAKSHIGEGKRFEYVHEFGEDGGKRPHLIIDHEGMPILHGGDYKIRAEGIVN